MKKSKKRMIYLNYNEANQTIHLTLSEARSFFADSFTHYLVVFQYEDNTDDSNNRLAQVATIVTENERDTELTVTTVGLENSGQYFYVVYGQNSSSNTDTENVTVVGKCEQGRLILLKDGEQPTYSDSGTPTIKFAE
jgi:hypothetical protein